MSAPQDRQQKEAAMTNEDEANTELFGELVCASDRLTVVIDVADVLLRTSRLAYVDENVYEQRHDQTAAMDFLRAVKELFDS